MDETKDTLYPPESSDTTLPPHIRILQQPIIRFFSRQETFDKIERSYNVKSPEIQVVGYSGPVLVMISCVTKDPPFRPHPHNLIGKWCRTGVCYLETDNEEIISLDNLAVATVSSGEVVASLHLRGRLQVDPFRTGFSHMRHPDELDLTSVRLAIQGFLKTSQSGYVIPLDTVLSEPIYSQKIKTEDIISCKDPLDITTNSETPPSHELSTDSPLPKEVLSIKIEPEEIILPSRSPYIQIVVQPQSKGIRFRYECESRVGGSIQGVGSTCVNKNSVKVKVVGYDGPALMMVCLVTKEPPYRQHPFKLFGRASRCKDGVWYKLVKNASEEILFDNIGVCCVKKRHLQASLTLRESLKVDPFQAGFSHKEKALFMDLSVVRLCFQAFIPDPATGQFTKALSPVVSDPIINKKLLLELFIIKLSPNSSSVAGHDEVILLCEKVSKDDIKVRFYEVKNNELIWEDFGSIELVHKQTAIYFKTPKYRLSNIDRPVQVSVQLFKPSDSSSSDSLPFIYMPSESHLNLDHSSCQSVERHEEAPKENNEDSPKKYLCGGKKQEISELNFKENRTEELCPSLPFVNNQHFSSFLNFTPEIRRTSFLGVRNLSLFQTSSVDCDQEKNSVLPIKCRKRSNMNCIDYVYLNSSDKKDKRIDPDEMFLLSILPFLHQLSSVENLQFQEDVIRILKTMMYPRAVLLRPFSLPSPTNDNLR